MPGSYININIDRNINVVENDSTKSLNDIKEKYKSLEGLYIVAKVRHIITPGKIKNNKQRYRQNLVIMRNFIYK
jgi:ribose 1,5-bisphosphokinase PhnN